LAIGDTLKATLVFVPSNVTASSGSRGMRIGLFNFSESGASQVAADGFSTGAGGGAQGTNVTGYLLNMNFAESLSANPLQIMKRTDLGTNNLMGALAVFTSLGSGGGPAGPGFKSGEPYTFEFTLVRGEGGVEITTRFSDTNGWSIAHTVTDANNPNLRFDGLALRPNAVADSAQAFTFTQCKVELLPFELRISSIALLPPFNDTALSFPTQRGKAYQLEWRANFSPGSSWNSLGEVINGDGAVATRVDSDASFEVERYYRLVEWRQ
jgi:hypothetical protein